MYHNVHTEFILTPIQAILAEGISACNGIGDGIETQPLSEYILASLFLKLTGAQEQKLKCICWEIATHDYDFRSQFMQGNYQLGEYSDYKSKNKIYSLLIERTNKQRGGGQKIDDGVKNSLTQEAISMVTELFQRTNVWGWKERAFISYQAKCSSRVKSDQILVGSKESGLHLFESVLRDDYKEIVYNHRNRLAHNTTSYQRHLPKFEVLASKEYDCHNYFYRYTLLILIDLIFIHLYKEYRDGLESDSSDL